METKAEEVKQFSNPKIVKQLAKKYLGNDAKVFYSTRKNKKYMIESPDGKWIHFGSMNPPMEDFTKHQDEERRKSYLARATNINGNWKNNAYSPNNLSIKLLWNG